MSGSLCDVKGLKVGHAHDDVGMTGVTVVLCDEPLIAGMDRRGMASSTRQVDSLLDPLHVVAEVDAIVITGGSAFGLSATGGVLQWLARKGRGIPTLYASVPICPTAALFDLGFGDPRAYPDEAMGRRACDVAGTTVRTGSVGAGIGATVGKLFSVTHAMKGGVGTASISIDDVVVSALAVVNAFGDIVDPENGRIIAGARVAPDSLQLADTCAQLLRMGRRPPPPEPGPENTTICVVATNARLDRTNLQRLARMAQSALPRVIRPVHAPVDGDVLFTLATGQMEAPLNRLGVMAGDAVVEAILNAVQTADGMGRLPAVQDIPVPGMDLSGRH